MLYLKITPVNKGHWTKLEQNWEQEETTLDFCYLFVVIFFFFSLSSFQACWYPPNETLFNGTNIYRVAQPWRKICFPKTWEVFSISKFLISQNITWIQNSNALSAYRPVSICTSFLSKNFWHSLVWNII